MFERNLRSTSSKGILTESFPYRLFEKAKRFGTWNPADIDFSNDTLHWQMLNETQQNEVLRLISQFQAGEEAVTLDLLPLIMAIAKEGRLEEEMYLTTFLFEEAKHTDFFNTVLKAIGETGDLTKYHSDTYKRVFYDLLPRTMGRLMHDQSPEAIADASTVYNMFVEGVLAETGYYSFYQSLQKANIMPGLLEGIGYLKRDESRHIGYGTFLLQRLISEHPPLYEKIVKRIEELTPLAFLLNQEGVDGLSSTFGVSVEDMMTFTTKQLKIRMDILARAKGRSVEDIYNIKEEDVGVL
ncbi:R2-like ligand-binding oxidase [Bacillus sp. HMF5848]|nr:R2-like ligand-binding oxidase [Bacillus sp. HMF5848]